MQLLSSPEVYLTCDSTAGDFFRDSPLLLLQTVTPDWLSVTAKFDKIEMGCPNETSSS